MRIAEPAWAILFLLTPLREGRLRRHDGLHRAGMHFYSRPCGRGDDVEGSAANTAGVFLLTPLREGRHTAAAPVNPTSCISTHAPAGGATRGTSCPCLSLCNFYSRPCGRGDLRDFPVFHVGIAISTHAPAGGATIGPHSFRKVYAVISTHAPAGGATQMVLEGMEDAPYFYSRPCGRGDCKARLRRAGASYFYSRPCGRGDVAGGRCFEIRALISTHAPAGGATPSRSPTSPRAPHFYSRPCGRGDPMASSICAPVNYFYSRPCGRGDL